MPPILSIPAAARLLGLSRTTLWTWIQTRPEWQACVATRIQGPARCRTYLSTERLRAQGFLGEVS